MNNFEIVKNYVDASIEYQIALRKLKRAKSTGEYINDKLKHHKDYYYNVVQSLFDGEAKKLQRQYERQSQIKSKKDKEFLSLLQRMSTEEFLKLREDIITEITSVEEKLTETKIMKDEIGTLKHASDYASEKYQLSEKELKEMKSKIQEKCTKLETKVSIYKNIITVIDRHLKENRNRKLEQKHNN